MQEPVRGPAVCVECAERTGREGKEDSPCALYLGHIHLRTRRQENIMFQLPSNPFPTGPQLLGFRGVGGVIVPENKLRPVNSKSNSLPPACQSLAGGIFARKRQYERKRSSTEAPGQATGHPRSVHVRFYLSPERPINQAEVAHSEDRSEGPPRQFAMPVAIGVEQANHFWISSRRTPPADCGWTKT